MGKGWESGIKATIAVALIVVAFFGVNIAADTLLPRARVDLTESKLFTLTPGTKRILESLSRPVTFTFYYSESVGRGNPAVQTYAKRVAELLEEFRLHSRGKITLEIIEPETFSVTEDRALRDGMRGVKMGPGEVLYLGLVISNDTDGREAIPFFDPTRERFLEYELARALTVIEHPERPKVFVMSSLPVNGVDPTIATDPRQARPWLLMRELRSVFEVRVPSEKFTAIDADADLLLVIHPQGFSAEHQKLIEDFIASGKPTIVCVDPLCEADVPPDMQNPLMVMQHHRASSLNGMLDRWGVSVTEGMVIGDLTLAMRAPDARGRGEIPYLQYLALRGGSMASEEPMLRGIGIVNVAMAGSIEFDASKGTSFTPLLWSTDQSMLFESVRYELLMDPQGLLAAFAPAGKSHVIAGLVRGRAEGDSADVNLLVCADVDLLTDPLWVQESLGEMGRTTVRPVASNADFVTNAIEMMCGSPDLLAVRARGTYARPFTLVERIRRDAEAKFLTRAEELQAREADVERRLVALVQQGAVDPSGKVLSPQVQEEFDRLTAERLKAREDLREVQFDLRKDVERLGTRVQLINTAAAPIAVALGALGLGAYRAARRRADRGSMAGKG